jgi:hypothetical protein
MMQHTQGQSVALDVWTTGLVPFDMRSLDAE